MTQQLSWRDPGDNTQQEVNTTHPLPTFVPDLAGGILGNTTDPAIKTDAVGTIQQYLRGLVAIFANVWNSTSGYLSVGLATLISGEDQTANRLLVEERNSYAYISTAVTTVVKSGAGFFHTLTVDGGAAGTIIVYDNTAASGNIIASFDATNVLASYRFDVSCTVGLTIITSAATKLTVGYR